MKRVFILACALACVLSVKCCEAQITGSNNGSTISVNGLAQQTAFATVIAPSGDTTGAIDSAAVNAVCSANGWAQLKPASTYYLTGITVSNPCKITGGGFSTKVVNPSATANLFTVNYSVPGGTTNMTGKGAVISDFEIVQASGVTPTAGCAFSVAAAAGAGNYVTGLHVQNIHVYGLYQNVCVGTGVISDWFQNMYISGMVAGAAGCIDYNNPVPGGDIHFDAIECNGNGAGITIRQADSTQFTSIKTNGTYGVTFTQAGPTRNIRFINPSIEGTATGTGCGVDFGSGTTNKPSGISIVGGEIGIWQHALCNTANTVGLGYAFTDAFTSDHATYAFVTNIASASGVTSINTSTGDFTFSGAGVSCSGTTCTFSGGGSSNTPNVTTSTLVDFSAGNLVFNNPAASTGALQVNLDPISATPTSGQVAPGWTGCVRNYTGKSGVITVVAPTSTYIDKDGVNSSAAGTLASGGALGDEACFTAAAVGQYTALIRKGTWTLATPGQAFDYFSGGSGALSAHTSDSGHTWANYTALDSLTLNLNGTGAVVAASGANNASAYISLTPSSADYTVTVDVTSATDSGSLVAAAMGRINTAAQTYYGAYNIGGTCQLYKVVTGTSTQLGSNVACAWANPSTHTIALVMSGTSISMKLDGATIIGPITDSAISAAGKAGIRLVNSGLASMDNFKVQ